MLGIVANLEVSGNIENSRNSGSIIGAEEIAGICINNNSKITNCTNEATITKRENSTSKGIKISGICVANNGVIDNCKNTADITSINTQQQTIKIGAICASNFNSGIIQKCDNTGKIKTEGKDINVEQNDNKNIQGCTNSGTGEIDRTNIGTVFVGMICGKIEEE